jgi:hypothetical protein
MPSVCLRAMVPQRGIPFSPRGPGGPVPPLPRYYGTLRLPAAPLAALRYLRLAIPSFRPSFVPVGLGRGPRINLELVSRVSGRHFDGDDRVSQVPGDPSCALALFFDPGGIGHARPLRRADAVPAADKSEDSHEKLSGLNRTAWTLAVSASQGGSPLHHARRASGCWPSSAGRDSFTRRVPTKGFTFVAILLFQASWRNVSSSFRRGRIGAGDPKWGRS